MASKLIALICVVIASTCLAAIVAAQGDDPPSEPCTPDAGAGRDVSFIGTKNGVMAANVPNSPDRPECSADSEVIGHKPLDDISSSSEQKFRSGLVAITATVVALIAPQAASGAELPATPSTLDSVFAKADPGDTIELGSGSYGTFRGGMKAGRVALRPAPGADVSIELYFSPAANVTVSGVTLTDAYVGPGSRNITIRNSDVPGQVILRDLTDSNVTLDDNVHHGWDKCDGCAEGRVWIAGDHGRPSGVTIKNSEFVGGVSDGIQNGSDGTKIIHNHFHDLKPGTPDGVHTDAIQLYGSRNTIIRGNYIHDVPDAIMAPDGTDHEVIENNVIAGDRGGYPYAVTIWSDEGSIIRHNTLADGACMFNLRCGILSIGSKSGQPAGRGTVIEDNIVNDISIGDGNATVASRSNNLLFGGRAKAPGEIRGMPVFVGGADPNSRSDYALAPGSPGRGAASDGLDMGAVIDRSSACRAVKKQRARAAKKVARARRTVRRADGRQQTRRARAKLRTAKRRLREARRQVDQLC